MNGLISARQLMMVVALMRASIIVVFLPVVTQGEARQDAWIAAVLTTLVGCLIGAMMASLAMRFPGQSFGAFSGRALGRPLGLVASASVALTFYGVAVVRARLLSLVLVSEVFQHTPGWVFGIPIWLAGLYGSVLGPDSMGRAAEIIFTVVIVSIATGVLLLFMSGMGPLTNLKPVLERGWGPVFEAALTPIFFFATTSAMVLAFGKYVTEPSRMRRAVVAGLLIAGALLTSLSILAITSLGPHHVGHELTPLLALAKNVYIPGVIERSDLLLLGIWMLGVVFDVTVLLLAASIILGDAFGVSFRYVALALFFVGVPAVSFRVTDLITLPKVFAPLPAAIVTLAIYIGVVGLVYGAALVRGKGGTDG